MSIFTDAEQIPDSWPQAVFFSQRKETWHVLQAGGPGMVAEVLVPRGTTNEGLMLDCSHQISSQSPFDLRLLRGIQAEGLEGYSKVLLGLCRWFSGRMFAFDAGDLGVIPRLCTLQKNKQTSKKPCIQEQNKTFVSIPPPFPLSLSVLRNIKQCLVD